MKVLNLFRVHFLPSTWTFSPPRKGRGRVVGSRNGATLPLSTEDVRLSHLFPVLSFLYIPVPLCTQLSLVNHTLVIVSTVRKNPRPRFFFGNPNRARSKFALPEKEDKHETFPPSQYQKPKSCIREVLFPGKVCYPTDLRSLAT